MREVDGDREAGFGIGQHSELASQLIMSALSWGLHSRGRLFYLSEPVTTQRPNPAGEDSAAYK